MDIPTTPPSLTSSNNEDFDNKIAELEKQLNKSPKPTKFALIDIQEKLDALASTTQFDESLGKKRKKLYELQAIIHHLKGEKLEAVNAISYAMTLNGGVYPEASDLLDDFIRAEEVVSTVDNVSPTTPAHTHPSQTSDQNTPGALPLVQPPLAEVEGYSDGTPHSKQNPEDKKSEKFSWPEPDPQEIAKNLQGISGWLVVFLVAVGISIIAMFYSFVDIAEIAKFENANRGGAGMAGFIGGLNFACLVLFVTIFIQILQKKSTAVKLTIFTLLFGVTLNFIIFIWVVILLSGFNLSSGQYLTLARPLAQSVISAAVWITYFKLSKRVKATLIE